MDTLAAAVARVYVRELRSPDEQHIDYATDWAALGQGGATVLLHLSFRHLPVAGQYEGSGAAPT